MILKRITIRPCSGQRRNTVWVQQYIESLAKLISYPINNGVKNLLDCLSLCRFRGLGNSRFYSSQASFILINLLRLTLEPASLYSISSSGSSITAALSTLPGPVEAVLAVAGYEDGHMMDAGIEATLGQDIVISVAV